MKVLLIVNPRAGREKASAIAQTLKRLLLLRGIGCDIRLTAGSRDAERFIARSNALYDTVICLGGDGTLSETVNGLMQSEQKSRILYLPTGTTNDFARGLKLSDNTESAVAAVMNGTCETLDVGMLNERYFIYSAAFGIFTDSAYLAPQELKNRFGRLAYFRYCIQELPHIKSYHLRLTDDQENIHEGDYLFGCIMNATSVGGFLQIKQKDMSLNDGLHEVLLIRRPDSVGAFSKILSAVLRHDYTAEGIEFFHTSTLICESTEPMEWALDGEQFSSDTAIRFQNCPSSVNILLPKSRRLAS